MRLFILLITFILFKCFKAQAEQKTLKFRADYWCPYNCKPTDNRKGFIVDILEKIFVKEGLQINYDTLNWARAILKTRSGEFDAIIGAAKNDAPDFVFPDTPLGNPNNCFYTRTDSTWKYTDINSVKDITLGIIKDYAYFEALDNYIKNPENQKHLEVNFGDDVQIKLLLKLLHKRMDVFVEDATVIQFIQKQNPQFKEIRKAGCVISEPVYVAFSPQNPSSKKYAKIFDNRFKELKRTGELQKIFEHYGINP